MPPDPHLPARLLSGRPEMAAPEKDAVLVAVLARVAEPPRPRLGSLRWALVAAGAAAALLLIAGPLALGWFRDRPASDALVARGGGPDPFDVQATCPGSAGCRAGAKLIFRVRAPAGRPWFSAFGQRPDGVVAWYFPATEDLRSVDTRQARQDGVLPAGVLLATDHPPGQVALRGQFCAQPLGRAQIRAVYERNVDPESIGCTLVENAFQVSP